MEVLFPEENLPEEYGKLYLFPVDEQEFYLELLFLQHTSDADLAQVTWLKFSPSFFEQYPQDLLLQNQPFRFDKSTEYQYTICAQMRIGLEQMQQVRSATPFIQSLQENEFALQLLRRSLEVVTTPFTACQVPACRFLAYESERSKILDARMIIDQNPEQSHSIKDLSRKVAMNECYLKKGFKALVGKGIHEYHQEVRIRKAKELLKQTGQSVSDVANMLGYSSISHFSTAFKKATGMKPCELLS